MGENPHRGRGSSIEGKGVSSKHLCFLLIMYVFSSNHALYPASLLFTMFVFLLTPLINDTVYIQSNSSLV